MSSPLTYLITGPNRGIGKGLLATYLSRSNSTVIAGVRDPSNPSSKTLTDLPKGHGSNLITVKIDSASETDAEAAAKLLQSTHNIQHIDVVIANAGIGSDYSTALDLKVTPLKEHIAVNTIGPLALFQAFFPLLQKSIQPKFVYISSPLASIGGMEQRPFPMAAYGASKAAMNYFIRKIHFENEGLVSFAIDPGFVKTDMGNNGAVAFGMKEAITSVEDSVKYLVATVDESTREKTSGHFPTLEGGDFPW